MPLVHLCERQTVASRRALEGAMGAAGGLEHDALDGTQDAPQARRAQTVVEPRRP